MNYVVGDHVVSYRLAGRELLVCEPGTLAYGHTIVELVHGLALARRSGADVVIVKDPEITNRALYELELDGIRVLRGGPLRSLVLLKHFAAKQRLDVDAFRHELGVELKHRTRETNLSQRGRLAVGAIRKRNDDAITKPVSDSSYFRRDLMVTPLGARLRYEAHTHARIQAESLGLAPDAPVVCLHVREPGFKWGREQEDKEWKSVIRMDVVRNASIVHHFPACDELVAQGYTVVRIGDPSMTSVKRKGYIDLATSERRNGLLELYCMFRAELLIVGESGPNVLGYLTDTPILCVNATDPFSSYPARHDGHVMFKQVVDRQTGRPLRVSELIEDEYLGDLRNPTRYRFDENTPEELVAAVRESIEWIRGNGVETERQAAFRDRITKTSLEQRERSTYVRKWGPENGFLGNGRVVDFQLAERQ
ncbi:MAG TPA: TIGR04372 family glycosyltransferase [Plantibacter sp.]|uniref:TIGR04372 family glycosyltransferase n=1 Tax=Plantibacter sp. TaxID=1871045 RepID=UPI002C94CF4E|nr:TIGR04372 family glycosyltransferase [Plantibacter sp.]